MTERTSRSRAARRIWWVVGLVTVPTVLAGVALGWPGPQLADDLRQRSERALDVAGLPGVIVTVSGRDAELTGVPGGAERAAAEAVMAVTGIRDVRVGAVTSGTPPSSPDTPPSSTAPTGLPGARPGFAEQLAALLVAAPITFPADDAELTAAATATVRRVARLLMAAPAARVEVEGHAVGTPEGQTIVARRLSERRAVVVADALVAAGVDRDRITTTGRGAEHPLATPTASRRVEISAR